MSARLGLRLTVIVALGLLLQAVISAVAATNTIPSTKISNTTFAINANALKPAQCAGLNLTSIKTGSGIFSGNSGGTLILGSSGADTITGQSGADCILGGGGNDTLIGGDGNDVLIGGPGVDSCTGGLGTDVLDSSCEVQIP